MAKLPLKLKNKPFTYREACEQGLTQYVIRKLLEAGIIERVARGLYREAGGDYSDEEAYRDATKLLGEPSAVCLLSALSHYDVTDTIPRQVWLMVPAEKRTSNNDIKLYRAREPKWESGVTRENGYSITSLERSIVEALTLKTLVPARLGIDALKQAIAEKKTTASKVLKMADELGLKHRVLTYIEALS